MKGTEVFRFVCLRSPKKVKKAIRTVWIDTALIKKLRKQSEENENAQSFYVTAEAYLNAPDFKSDVRDLPLYELLLELEDKIDEGIELDINKLKADVVAVFGKPVEQLVETAEFIQLRESLIDGMVAIRMHPERSPEVLAEYSALYRVVALLDSLVQQHSELSGMTFKRWKAQHIVLPDIGMPVVSESDTDLDPTGSDSGDAEGITAREQEVAALVEKNKRIERTIQELLDTAPADIEPDELHVESSVEENEVRSVGMREPSRQEQLVANYGSRTLLKPVAIEALSATAHEILSDNNLDPSQKPLNFVLGRLEKQASEVAYQLSNIRQDAPLTGVVKIGNTLVPGKYLNAKFKSPVSGPAGPGGSITVGPPKKSLVSFARPSGVGSLLLSREHILRYEAGEIAHIENVMQGESKERETRRLRRTEETIVYENETTREEERDLQSTERMELQREIQDTLSANSKMAFGTGMSAKYGEILEVNLNTEIANEMASESVARSASSFAKEVTERTVSTLTERIREEQTTKTLQEFEEKNRHSLDASNSDDHIVGMFRWINRVYQAQVYDYGVRLFFDFMIPEPARVLLYTKYKAAMDSNRAIVPPKPLSITADELNMFNYHTYVRDYQVKGVNPPPKLSVTVSESYSFDISQTPEAADPLITAKDETIRLPEGYEAIEGQVRVVGYSAVASNEERQKLAFCVGRGYAEVQQLENNYITRMLKSFRLNNEVESVPVTILTECLASYTLQVQVWCKRTSYALAKWKQETYDAILEAYQIQLANYEEKISAQNASEGVDIKGRNPLQNRQAERDELKRAAISIISEQHFEKFNGYQASISIPKIDFAKAATEGAFARFFEQVFEWENMTYELLPYYWGKQEYWLDTLQIEDPDPEHQAFLRAGYARIRVPVTPEFEAAVFHYLETGKIWKGGELPEVTHEKHLPFLEEIKARREDEGPVTEVPVGDSYQYTLPTTLVRVEDGNTLPKWTQADDGTWIEVENTNEP